MQALSSDPASPLPWQGSALVEFDLARAEAVKCEAVILLCDNLCSGAQLEDSGTILRALAMSKYLNLQSGGSSHKIPIIMELRQVKISTGHSACCPGSHSISATSHVVICSPLSLSLSLSLTHTHASSPLDLKAFGCEVFPMGSLENNSLLDLQDSQK